MENVGQIKKTEGWRVNANALSVFVSSPYTNTIRDRANLRLADVENSGRADVIWLNKYTGAGTVWKNNRYRAPMEEAEAAFSLGPSAESSTHPSTAVRLW